MGIAVLLGATVLAALLSAGPVHGAGGGAPLAEAGLDQEVRSGETVRLDATGSYDPDGRVAAYEWRVRAPDGRTTSPHDPRSARTSFRPTAVGRYEVTLTVTDGEGRTGTDAMYVVVEPGSGDGGGASTVSTDGESTPAGSSSSGGGGDWGDGCSGTGGSAGVCSASRGVPTVDPRARIDGPEVVTAGRSYTYTAETRGLAGDRTYDWDGGDTGRSHTLVFETGGRYTTRVTVEDGRGRSAEAGLELFVQSVENERPDVEITGPGRPTPGQRLVLSAEASDPDGRVLSTEWSPGRRVTVPTDGSSRTVRVTVTDEDGASVTDSITVSGRTWNRTTVGADTHDVTCYFTQDRHRDGRLPYSPRCIRENGNTVALGVGPSHIGSYRRNEKIDLHWRRTTEERLQGLRANDTSTDYGVAAGSPQDEADLFGYSDDVARIRSLGRLAHVNNAEAFTLNGRTVEDDIDGDGEVNAADWDQEYRTDDDAASGDPHADASKAFKRAVHGDGVPDASGDPARRATARTVEGSFAGTSIDAENRRDRIAAYSRSVSSGEGVDDASGGHDGTGPSGGPDPTGGGNDGDTGSESGTTTRGVTDVNDGDRDDSDDETHRTGGTERDDGGSGTGGPSRHSPHGGRIVVLP